MGHRERPLFDLNEAPPEEEEVSNDILFQPQKSIPSPNPLTANLLLLEQGCQRILNNNAFIHASSSSGFQPFVRSKGMDNLNECAKEKTSDSDTSQISQSTAVKLSEDNKVSESMRSCALESLTVEREEGELCDIEGNTDVDGSNNSSKLGDNVENTKKRGESKEIELSRGIYSENNYRDSGPHGTFKNEVEDTAMEDATNDVKDNIHLEASSSRNPDVRSKRDTSADSLEEPSFVLKLKDVKGVEANHALRLTNHPGKRSKLDEHKEAMLGKKRARQTVFIPMEDAKQVGPMKTSTLKRQASLSAPIISRTVKEAHRDGISPAERTMERQSQLIIKERKKHETFIPEVDALEDLSNQKGESNGDVNSGPEVQSKKLDDNEFPMEEYPPSIPRQGSWKHPVDSRQFKNSQILSQKSAVASQNTADLKLGSKKLPPSKKQTSNNTQYQDTSVERLLREVTNEKFWRRPDDTELQCVPGCFDSVEDYVRVFEPLLFEECRAQLYSTWEELTETASKDARTIVRVKAVERRERGWYDMIALPAHECKWTFKEGDVAILSSNRPDSGLARSKRSNNSSSEEDMTEVSKRIAGTVRRHIPTDTRDPPGIILHFYVGESYGSSSKVDDDHILRKLQPKSVWYITVLGSITTAQREYIALHAFRRLNLQMQTAILKPSPEHFPKYEEQLPAMPECFTQNFVDHLHRTFNGPQLAAIQWAAMHTAAGTSSGASKRQDPWPFTLVQGPPGTGKTHTVWGMLNVIHLVQYQRYYTALLKKLAPESYKQVNESNSEIICNGSIDEVLQSMDQNLFRTLPKLCPKPRMLVCAPSNAATDELLARVLDRGFIDGEMKVYRPDVARVGVDSQTRAAQAVSVERRTEQLLLKSRDEVLGWLHQLKAREAQFSQQITHLQRELNIAAAAGRSQGSVGVDPDVLMARDHNRDVLLQNLAAVVEGRDKVLVEMSRLLILEKRIRLGSSFDTEDVRASLEASFANEAEIVFTTVSSSGRKIFSRLSHGFDMVVIDEAAQASEVAILPPLSLGAARCVLVGDPQQLPATVISKAAGNLLYSRSLFERFQQGGCPTILLSVQYRMHPQIRDFPSRYFYQGRLTDSESVANLADEAYYKDPLLLPYIFYDITRGRESQNGGSVSYQNIQEAQFSLRLYEHLQKFLKSNGGKKVSVGIITPYKLQLKCIQREFEEVLSSEEGKDLYINTVDAFQGQERDVIIMSCVRASNHGVGFVADIRRMNVALTRARRALWVVGNANALMRSDDWAALIMDAKSRKCFLGMDVIPKDFLVAKGSIHAPGRASSNNMKNLRTSMHRSRHMEMHQEHQSGIQSEDDEKSSSYLPRNCSYRNLKPIENSMNEEGQSGERSVDAPQFGVVRRQTTPGAYRRDM